MFWYLVASRRSGALFCPFLPTYGPIPVSFIPPHTQWRPHKFLFVGTAQGVSGTKVGQWDPGVSVLQWVQGQSPVSGLGQSPPEAKAFCRHCLDILTAEMIKIWKLPNSPSDSSLVCLTVRGLSDVHGGLTLGHAWGRHCRYLVSSPEIQKSALPEVFLWKY